MKRLFCLVLVLAIALAGFAATPSLRAADKKPNTGSNVKVKKDGVNHLEIEWQEMLQRCDQNKDTAVTFDEFMKHQAAGKDPAIMKKWFDKKDANSDGKVIHDEYVPPPVKK